MNIPVAILRDMSSDRSREVFPLKTMVFVIEDVIPIPLELGWKVRIPEPQPHQFERPPVVVSHCPSYVIEDNALVFRGDMLSSSALEFRPRLLVTHLRLADAVSKLWEVPDCVAQRRMFTLLGPFEHATSESNENRPLAMWGYAKPPRLHDLHVGFVAGRLQPVRQISGRAHIVTKSHIRHVLHQHCARPDCFNHSQEGPP